MSSPFSQPASDVLAQLEVDATTGLTEADARSRLDRYGPNRLRRQKTRSGWSILVAQFKGFIVVLLLAALVLSLVTGDWIEAMAIAVVILLNATIGFFSEFKAARSMEALRRLGSAAATVRRGGTLERIDAEDLVPGDIVVLDAGDVVTADLRLVESSKLQANESALTGESAPVSKSNDAVDELTPLAERTSMLFKGTSLTRGSGDGVVCATGLQTELGIISSLVADEPDDEQTPLERRLVRLGRRLVWLTIIIAIVVAIACLLRRMDLFLVLKTAIALAVAAVPEGLPIVATLALARGMWRMARRNVLVNRLAAVETLGATTVILTDKTGTLTEDQMTVREVVTERGRTAVGGPALEGTGDFRRDDMIIAPADDPELIALLEVGVLCNNASWSDADEPVGDPMEVALLVAGGKAGLRRASILERLPETDQLAFDPEVDMMTTYHDADGRTRVAVKGAPEAVLDACTSVRTGAGTRLLDTAGRERWARLTDSIANAGQRTLAFAEKMVDAPAAGAEPYADLTLLGVAGLVDPPRAEVRGAIEGCRSAGIRVVMATGDHPSTARHVAEAVGLDMERGVVSGRTLARSSEPDVLGTSIFARVSPKQKLDLIRHYQENGEIVAMTGDGVNDAPALKCADIGVAMGVRGTDVAREASDMVLRDDAFGSIVAAVAQGRVMFDNIRAFICYLVSCNLSEIVVVLLGALAGTPLPILPLQILFLNLVTDVFPALALGLSEGDARVMQRGPRDPRQPILTRRLWIMNGIFGTIIAAAVLIALLVALHVYHMDEQRAITVSFLTLAVAQLWHVFNMRARGSSLLRNEVTRNAYVWIALALCVVLVLAAVYVPVLSAPLRTADPGWQGWLLVLVMSLVPVVLGQAWLSWGPGAESASARS